jgi:hypothetical protein
MKAECNMARSKELLSLYLNESNGISQNDPKGLTTIYGPIVTGKGPVFTLAGGLVDWNFN